MVPYETRFVYIFANLIDSFTVSDSTKCREPSFDDPPICGPDHVSAEKYPYLALIFLNCRTYTLNTKFTAVIISSNYLIGVDPHQLFGKCDSYSVQIGADEQGRRGIMYETKLIVQEDKKKDSFEDYYYFPKLVLYRLIESIKFNLRAQPVGIAEKMPETGDKAIAVGFNNNETVSWPKIFLMECYVTSEKDAVDLKWRRNNLRKVSQGGSLTAVHPLYECKTPMSSALIVNDYLSGLIFNSDEVYNGADSHVYGSCDMPFVWADEYIDVAYHRDWIKEHVNNSSLN
ncbi:hypothetical protein QAD02_016788 [Eretmocerus hayati]|uniref:Uncharacterized protein n=1 Tax=Eretmocerus hayati TaxID=131215 RepID=A0ACC2PDB9_9HYME|nr:hypothetical protein QAD02_016788 [Eretmocerus hayati]